MVQILLGTVLISVLVHDAMLELITFSSAELWTLPRIHVIRSSTLHLLFQPILVDNVVWQILDSIVEILVPLCLHFSPLQSFTIVNLLELVSVPSIFVQFLECVSLG